MLVKQVPSVDAMTLDDRGRLHRQGVPLEMNAFCRRAVTTGVTLAREQGGRCTVITVGPPSAEDVVREAVACGADLGVVVTDPVMAGADTLATARAAAAAVSLLGPFDLVLAGRSSVDADTGQVGPELAELLGLPFVAAARHLQVVGDGAALVVRAERDDGWREVRVALPAVLSAAERLTDPCKQPPAARAAVPAERIRHLHAVDLGPGPWGEGGSPTRVGAVRTISVERAGIRLAGPVDEQVRRTVAELAARGLVGTARMVDADGPGPGGLATMPGAAEAAAAGDAGTSPGAGGAATGAGADEVVAASAAGGGDGPVVAVLGEPAGPDVLRELLGEAAALARTAAGTVWAVGPDLARASTGAPDAATLGSWGADRVLAVTGTAVEEDLAHCLADAWAAAPPWAVLAPGTLWGREVAGRLAARLGAGLTGDAVGLGVGGGRLVGTKPAFGGQLVVDVTATGEPQIATVRPGVLPRRRPRRDGAVPEVETMPGGRGDRVSVLDAGQDDDVTLLSAASAVVCVGRGVDPGDYPLLDPLLAVLGATLGATRKVTDQGWLPRSRQIGITGHSVAPAVLVLIGVGGSTNHMVSSRGAGTVVAVNSDPTAAVFDWVDVGMVGDWRQIVPALAASLAAAGASCGGEDRPEALAAPAGSAATID